MSTKVILSIFAVFVIVMLSMLRCSPSSPRHFDPGGMEGNRYANPYFKMTIDLPAGWTSLSRKEILAQIAANSRMLSGGKAEARAQLAREALKTPTLFIFTKHPPDSADPNPGIHCVAENVAHFPGVTCGADYLFFMKKQMEAMPGPRLRFSPGASERLSGVEFDVQTAETAFDTGKGRQKFYAARIRDHIVTLVLAYDTDEEARELTGILKTLHFMP